jgi:peptidoglycan hydrolase-like protein with peptidoglycan-binding domain
VKQAFDAVASLFRAVPPRATGALENPEDYRDIALSSFQKPAGAPARYYGLDAVLAQLEIYDQGEIGECVPSAIGTILRAYLFRRDGAADDLSRRFGYRLCKLFDGHEGSGTFPRVGALVACKYGLPRAALAPKVKTADEREYLAFSITKPALDDAAEHRLPGFGFVEANIDAVKEAIYQNGAVAASMRDVGDWSAVPVKPGRPGDGNHYVVWYGYEDLPDGDTMVYIANSWGADWPRKPRDWKRPGRGCFRWSEYGEKVRDIIAFADVPAALLETVKSMPYRFTKELGQGVSDPAVRELQKLLNEDPETAVALEGAGSAGQETTFFGPATRAALARWQGKHLGAELRTGYFGPRSIAKANDRLPKRTLEEAIVLVESGGDDQAIGDRNLANKAYGAMQIRQPAVDDVNRLRKTGHRAQDCLGNRALSLQIFRDYCAIYEPNGTDEERARLWNAGPNWRAKRPATDGYWQKVRRFLS